MDIETKLGMNGELYIKPSGRIDVTNAVDFGGAVFDSIDDNDGIKKLTLDFAEIEYVSSMGLRILLELQKKMSELGEMTLINVKDDIKKVFDMTGFSKILKIKD